MQKTLKTTKRSLWTTGWTKAASATAAEILPSTHAVGQDAGSYTNSLKLIDISYYFKMGHQFF